MTISDVSIKLPGSSGGPTRLLAYASVVLDDWLCVRDFKLIRGRGRVFVSFPNKFHADRYLDVVFPIRAEARAYFEGAILAAYRDAIRDAEGADVARSEAR